MLEGIRKSLWQGLRRAGRGFVRKRRRIPSGCSYGMQGSRTTGCKGHKDAETKDTGMQGCQSRREMTSTLLGNSILFPYEGKGTSPMGF